VQSRRREKYVRREKEGRAAKGSSPAAIAAAVSAAMRDGS
jgi:hypothetical protein